MKNIGFITTNKMFAQSFAETIKTRPELDYNIFLLFNPQQAIVDAEVMKTNIAIIDVVNENSAVSEISENFLFLCEKLRKNIPECQILLLASQYDKSNREKVINAVKNKIADDFVLYDNSLEYLFAKLAAF